MSSGTPQPRTRFSRWSSHRTVPVNVNDPEEMSSLQKQLENLRIEDTIKNSTFDELESFAKEHGLEDNDDRIESGEDYATRILLLYRKMQGCSKNPFSKFPEVEADNQAKCDSMHEFLIKLYQIFSQIPTGPLSEVLAEERLLKGNDLLTELKTRIADNKEHDSVIIFAGETNAGKSSLLNVILGVDVLPIDVMHCTIAICKIKYSKTYRIETVTFNNERQCFAFEGWMDANQKLKVVAAQANMKDREKGTRFKEITLYMPAAILKSGVTLVDTPGIGEGDEMDDITMKYIRSSRASAFIYIIKSDHAGGIQEDRLVKFVKGIQDHYQMNDIMGNIDPQAALFICNRWDKITNAEMVKKNALTKLDIIWPGLNKNQVQFFSSKTAHLHLSADPEFVTDDLNDLLLRFKELFNRAAHNNIKHQYMWTKHFLQPASRHLSSWINHCLSSNDELEKLFRTVAEKQDTLKRDTNQHVPHYQKTLNTYREKLKTKVSEILSDVNLEYIDDYDQLLQICSKENFLSDSKNRQTLNQWIVATLINYCDSEIQESGILDEMEKDTKKMIRDHMGLVEDQVKDITQLVKGKTEPQYASSSNLSESTSSSGSATTTTTDTFDTLMDPTLLDQAVKNLFLKKNRSSKPLKTLKNTIFNAVAGLSHRPHHDYANPPIYLDNAIKEQSHKMRKSDDIVEGFAVGYLRLIQRYIESTIKRIPHFIAVNNILLDKIRSNRQEFHNDRLKMRDAMKALEPCREQLRGYGMLYMEDVNADLVLFNTDRRSSVSIESDKLGVTKEPHDSGFSESGSSRNKVRASQLNKVMSESQCGITLNIMNANPDVKSFWTRLRNAVITIDKGAEDVIVKSYTCHIDKTVQLSEIASLRSLQHKYLAPFFGMTRIAGNGSEATEDDSNSSQKLSAFIFKGSLVSARVFERNSRIPRKDFVRNLLYGLLSGLECIHREELIHLELNMDTVMVNYESGTVQLCHQCLPREIVLPSNLSICTKASVCLSPAVLCGHVYGISDDIYAFGLLFWELLFPDNLPYKDQRDWPLEKFIEQVSPSKMLGPEIEKLNASKIVINLLKGTLVNGHGRICMAMTDVKRSLTDFNLEERNGDDPNEPQNLGMKAWTHGYVDTSSKKEVDANGRRRRSSSILITSQMDNDEPKRPPRRNDTMRLGLRRKIVPSVPMNFMTFLDRNIGSFDSNEKATNGREKERVVEEEVNMTDGVTLWHNDAVTNGSEKSATVPRGTNIRQSIKSKSHSFISPLTESKPINCCSSGSREHINDTDVCDSPTLRRRRRVEIDRYSDNMAIKLENVFDESKNRNSTSSPRLPRNQSKELKKYSTIGELAANLQSSFTSQRENNDQSCPLRLSLNSKTDKGSSSARSSGRFSGLSSNYSSSNSLPYFDDDNNLTTNVRPSSNLSLQYQSFDSSSSDVFSPSRDSSFDLNVGPVSSGDKFLAGNIPQKLRDSSPTSKSEMKDRLKDTQGTQTQRSHSWMQSQGFGDSIGDEFSSSLLSSFLPSSALPSVGRYHEGNEVQRGTTTNKNHKPSHSHTNQQFKNEEFSNLKRQRYEQSQNSLFPHHNFEDNNMDEFLSSSTKSLSSHKGLFPTNTFGPVYELQSGNQTTFENETGGNNYVNFQIGGLEQSNSFHCADNFGDSINDFSLDSSFFNMSAASALPTMNPSNALPNLNISSALPTMNPSNAVTNLNTSSALPTMNLSNALPTMNPSSALPTMNPSSALPTMNPSNAVTNLNTSSALPTMNPSSSPHP